MLQDKNLWRFFTSSLGTLTFIALLLSAMLCVTKLQALPAVNVSGKVGFGGLTSSQKNAILFLHNYIRSQVQPRAGDMVQLRWDPILESIATNHAKKCKLIHNTDRHTEFIRASAAAGEFLKVNSTWIGENIAWGVGQCNSSPDSIDCGDIFEGIKRWYSEARDFNIVKNQCAHQCSLYTQLVWASTVSVGCGAVKCTDNKTILTCNYFPGGNYAKKLPYVVGNSCSLCPHQYNLCFENLCTETVKGLTKNEIVIESNVSLHTLPNNGAFSTSHTFTHPLEDEVIQDTVPQGWKQLNVFSLNIDVDYIGRVWAIGVDRSLTVICTLPLSKRHCPRLPETTMRFSKVSVTKDSVWSLLEDMHTIVHFQSTNNITEWQTIDTGDLSISTLECGVFGVVWILTSDGGIFYRAEISIENIVGISWSAVASDHIWRIKELSCGDLACWLIAEGGSVFVRYGISNNTPQGLRWISLNTTMSTITSGYRGYTIGKITAPFDSLFSTDLYFWRTEVAPKNPGGNGWLLLKLFQTNQLVVGPNIFVAIQRNHNLILLDSYPSEIVLEINSLKYRTSFEELNTNNSLHVGEKGIQNTYTNDKDFHSSVDNFLHLYEMHQTPQIPPSVFFNRSFQLSSPKPTINENHSGPQSDEINKHFTTLSYHTTDATSLSETTSSYTSIGHFKQFDTLEEAEREHSEQDQKWQGKEHLGHENRKNKGNLPNLRGHEQKKNRASSKPKKWVDEGLTHSLSCCEVQDSLCADPGGDCNSYIECEGHTAVKKRCRPDQIFDPYIRLCVEPWRTSFSCKTIDQGVTISSIGISDPMTTAHPILVPAAATLLPFLHYSPSLTEQKIEKTKHYLPRLDPNVSNHITGVLRETWFNLPNHDLSINGLIKDPRYPYFPDEYLILETFEAPPNAGDFYGQRLTTYYMANETGAYVFYLSCDDVCELWVGKNHSEHSLEKVAYLPENYSTDFREWNRYPELQATLFIQMEEGKFYLMEAFMRESRYKDHLSIGILRPGGNLELPISQNLYLVPIHLNDPSLSYENSSNLV